MGISTTNGPNTTRGNLLHLNDTSPMRLISSSLGDFHIIKFSMENSL